jgi:hypothetical protein
MRLLPSDWQVRTRLAITLAGSQLRPDFAIVRGHPRSFFHRHPTAGEVGLIIEVADSSLLRDQRDKARIYAGASIATYWIINLDDHQIEVMTQPSGPTASPEYASTQIFQPAEQLPLVLDGQTIASILVSELHP